MKLKKLFAAAISAVIMSTVSAITAFADSQAKIKIEQPKQKGDTFNVTVSIDADEDFSYMQSQLYYDERVIEYIDGDAIGGGGLINLQGFPDDPSGPVTLSLKFQVVGDGTSDISVENCLIFSYDGTVIGQPEARETVTPGGIGGDSGESKSDEDSSEADESSEADASSKDDSSEDEGSGMPTSGVLLMLMTDKGTLEPEFKFDIFDYEMHVDNSVEEVELTPLAASPDDTVTVSGDSHLEVGENLRTIKVVGDDDITITYRVNIIRAEPPEESSSAGSSEESSSAAEETVSSTAESSATDSSTVSKNNSEPDKYKRLLNPALAIVLVTLVVALIIILMWISSIRKKNKRRRKHRK